MPFSFLVEEGEKEREVTYIIGSKKNLIEMRRYC